MYIGLLTDLIEPDASTGYVRAEGDLGQTVMFDASTGYGMITHIGVYENQNGGSPVEIINLPEPVDIHAGVIPIVHNRMLYRGLDVTAKIVLNSAGNMNV